MYKFSPYLTNDNSTGLYNPDVGDVYHSAHGALTEAFEKFVHPLNIQNFLNKDVSILDICYGIGYNTKVFLNEFIKYKKNTDYDCKIKIDCVDTNETLIKLSPFILSEVNFLKRFFFKKQLYKNIENCPSANKIIKSPNRHYKKYKFDKSINLIILENLIKNYPEGIITDDIDKILSNNENRIFFDPIIEHFKGGVISQGISNYLFNYKLAFVHNIYYRYVLKRYKTALKSAHIKDISINFTPIDVRAFIKNTLNTYDVIFLDGFTPNKCPCIWTIDFIKQLYDHINNDGILTTYNMSAPVRNALLHAGFYIGDIKNIDGKNIGTIASKNPDFIKYKLSKKSLGMLSTKAGIPYKDEQLNLDNDIIQSNRLEDIKNSNLETASKFLKGVKNEI